MQPPSLSDFYDLTQDDAPVAQLPEVINLVSSDEDEPEPPPQKKARPERWTGRPFIERWADSFANTADAAAEQLAGLSEEQFNFAVDQRLYDIDKETRRREEEDVQFDYDQEFKAYPGPFRRLEPSATQGRLPLRTFIPHVLSPHDNPQMGIENTRISVRNRLGRT